MLKGYNKNGIPCEVLAEDDLLLLPDGTFRLPTDFDVVGFFLVGNLILTDPNFDFFVTSVIFLITSGL